MQVNPETEPLSTLESNQQPNNNLTRNQTQAASEADAGKLRELCTLLSQGITSKGDLIYALYGKKPGNSDKYREIEQEFTQLMRKLAEQSTFS